MSKYRKVYIRIWGDHKFCHLSSPQPNAQTLWFFLLTGPQTTRMPGLISTGEAGMAEMLRWPLDGFRKAFDEILDKGLVKVDWQSRLVWIPNAIKYNRPENPNVVKGWQDTWEELPECPLKLEVYEHLKRSVEPLGEGFAKAFQQACPQPKLNPLPNQEQEQEQEPEQKQELFSPSEKVPTKSKKARTHPRLEIYVEEYKNILNKEYIIGCYKEEGGAAKRTIGKLPDDEMYRQAVRAYLATKEQRLVENGYPFLWFIKEVNRWTSHAQRKMHAANTAEKYEDCIE